MEFHPLCEEYDLMSAHEIALMEADMRKFGFDERFPILLFQRKILDGRNRQIAADRAGVKPTYLPFDGDEDSARRFVERANENRRHLTQEWLQRRRQERIGRVAEARSEGKSIRTIAENEGVSRTTIERDIVESGITVPGGTVTGKDDRHQPAKKPELLCQHCLKRQSKGVALIKDCDACKQIRISASKKKKQEAEEKKSEGLPKDVANALADTWHAESARLLSKIRTECKAAFSWSTWLDAVVLDHLKAAEECFLTAMPRKACPECKGQKKIDKTPCLNCRQGGYMASQE